MKFSELKIGDEFQTVKGRGYFTKKILRTASYDQLSTNAILESNGFSSFVFFDKDAEVTQINKKACENCKWFDRNISEFNINTYCHKLGITIDDKEYYCLNQNTDTFYCSEFKRKE